MPSPLRHDRKAQHPREFFRSVIKSFSPHRETIESADSPRRARHSATMEQCGSCNEHPRLRVYTQFGPGTEDFRKAIVINRQERYPPESAVIRQFRQEQAELAGACDHIAPLPPPPSPRFALPFPTAALMMSPGSARDVFAIIKHQKSCQSSRAASLSSSPSQQQPQQPHSPIHREKTEPMLLPNHRSPPAAAASSSSRASPLDPLELMEKATGASTRSTSPQSQSPTQPLLPPLFDPIVLGASTSIVCGSPSTAATAALAVTSPRRPPAKRYLVTIGMERPCSSPRIPSSPSSNHCPSVAVAAHMQ